MNTVTRKQTLCMGAGQMVTLPALLARQKHARVEREYQQKLQHRHSAFVLTVVNRLPLQVAVNMAMDRIVVQLQSYAE